MTEEKRIERVQKMKKERTVTDKVVALKLGAWRRKDKED